MTPTQRTLALYREMGYYIDIVERFIHGAGVRRDYGGFADMIACHPLHGIVAVQSCAGSSHAAHADKVGTAPGLIPWLDAGGKVQLCSWSLRGARGKRKVWTARIDHIRCGSSGQVAAREDRDRGEDAGVAASPTTRRPARQARR